MKEISDLNLKMIKNQMQVSLNVIDFIKSDTQMHDISKVCILSGVLIDFMDLIVRVIPESKL